jgi:hypothetical protein
MATVTLLIVITLGAMGFTIWFADLPIIARLSGTLPLAVPAAHLARESSQHRSQASNARDLAMAMHTLPHYVKPLGADGAELRKVLGMRVFGSAAEQPEQGENGLFDDLPKALDALEEALRRIRDTMERRGGRP